MDTTTPTHTCVYFDDGGVDPACSCGERAVFLYDEETGESYLVVLDQPEPAGRWGTTPVGDPLQDLPISA